MDATATVAEHPSASMSGQNPTSTGHQPHILQEEPPLPPPPQQQQQQQHHHQPIRRVHSRVTLHENTPNATNAPQVHVPNNTIRNTHHHLNRRVSTATAQDTPRTSHMYVLFSIFVAFLAIVSPPGRISHSHRNRQQGQGGMMMMKTMANANANTNTNTATAPSQGIGITEEMMVVSSNNEDNSSASTSTSTTAKQAPKQDLTSTSNSLHTVAAGTGAATGTTITLSDIIQQKRQGGDNVASAAVSEDGGNVNLQILEIHKIFGNLFEMIANANTVAGAGAGAGNSHHDRQKQKPNQIQTQFSKEQKQKQSKEEINNNNNKNNDDPPFFVKWFQKKEQGQEAQTETVDEKKDKKPKSLSYQILEKFVDPSLLEWVRSRSGVIVAHGNDGNGTGENVNENENNHRDRLLIREQANRTATQIIDKILTSTPRILTIVNLLLAVTYLLHSVVADFFLGPANAATGGHGRHVDAADTGDAATAAFGQETNAAATTLMGMNGGVGASSSERINRSGRERLGGYLLFKLLLIAAVVKPDTLDLLILLSWYTLLAFLRSLSYLAGITTAHTAASGQSPHRGVLNLLLVVLLCDASAAATCAALFHGAGWGMVILLTCDCGLLALDIFTHLARFTQQVLDERHQQLVANLEMRQNQLYEERNDDDDDGPDDDVDSGLDATSSTHNDEEDNEDNNEVHDDTAGAVVDIDIDVDREETDDAIDRSSRQIDHEIEMLERLNERRLSTLDNTAFCLELIALLSTIAHFLHVWVLHGVTLNLVDGVLALHLHSALSAFGRKIAERRNHNRIVRDLDEHFDYATDMELMKANAAGDVCCICLCTMSMGSVKKLGCGHLYHTHCLREVVERARSIEAARCPLCRASVLDGKQVPRDQTNDAMPRGLFFGTGFTNMHQVGAGPRPSERGGGGANNDGLLNNNNNIPPETPNDINNRARSPDGGDNNGLQNQNERALFRLSTEGILPTWLPIPAFSFEIVRRFPPGEGDVGPPPGVTNIPRPHNPPTGNVNVAANANANTNTNTNNNMLQQQPQPQNNNGNSLWRRFLVLTGVAPLSPEELSVATGQIMDMFPQFDEETIVRELRLRGSTERVAEAILTGLVGGATGVVDMTENRNETEQGGERERIRDDNDVAMNQNQNGHDVYYQGYEPEDLY